MFLPTISIVILSAAFFGVRFFPSEITIPNPSLLSPKQAHASLPEIAITPTYYPSSTPTATPYPTRKPTTTPLPTRKPPSPTPTIQPTSTPSLSSTSSSVSLDSTQQYILDQINDYRISNGLSKVIADKATCDFARTRAQEISSSFNHDAFLSRQSSNSLPYPSYSRVSENIVMTSDYKEVVTLWKNSSGHAENMRADTPYVCISYTGNYYAYEGWKP